MTADDGEILPDHTVGEYHYPIRVSTFFMAPDSIPVPVQFIPVTEADLPRINELSNIPEIAEHFETIPPVSMETTKALWSYIQSGIMSLWGIHADGRIIGGAGFYAQPPGTRLSHSATFFLYIEPAYWGQGIGTQAIRFLENEAKTRGYLRMDCMVAATNPGAIRLYQRLGYETEGVKKQAFQIDETYKDLVIMGKVF
jgi:putative acetyltransferase